VSGVFVNANPGGIWGRMGPAPLCPAHLWGWSRGRGVLNLEPRKQARFFRKTLAGSTMVEKKRECQSKAVKKGKTVRTKGEKAGRGLLLLEYGPPPAAQEKK